MAWRLNHGRRQRRHGPTRSPTSDLRGAQMFQSADRSAGQITGRLGSVGSVGSKRLGLRGFEEFQNGKVILITNNLNNLDYTTVYSLCQ